ncbi:mannose-P-dolichol utilization defect 1 protein [Thelephora ganbajun]|uniref:Mannose-P-dolichol utilization defect 1 protein n=1 Tax=Thelephora ganbajun TaxID=370292 RepID=A0ACB6ZVJ3_THEGA|nr:mannose-P-dolichol utilization defect 1 protein [Thelephora ganbajun]
MTAITRNLPWFVKDLGVSIVGQKCYASIVEDLNFSDIECLKYSLSKGLGVGIVVGGSIMKLPQLLLILSARSARGISLTSYALETFCYLVTCAYSYRNEFPFSTYGENIFLGIQNIAVTLLIVYLPSSTLRRSVSSPSDLPKVLGATVAFAALIGGLVNLPKETIAFLQMTTLPLGLFSKLPQIAQNHRAKSTGQLSTFAVAAQILGCLARLFTTATEVKDTLVLASFFLALVLNVVLGLQIWVYHGKEVHDTPIGDISLEEKRQAIHAPVAQAWERPAEFISDQQIPARPSTPGRKWARKVD